MYAGNIFNKWKLGKTVSDSDMENTLNSKKYVS
jgi:hypothetical protein